QHKDNVVKQESADVLLEKIKYVSKLVTVEGYFSELYNYKDYWKYDWWPFQRKALIRVKAKVSAGYDLSQMKISADPKLKQITVSNLPKPQILSIDHDLDYYDISEGTFNSFTPEDYSRISGNAKKIIIEKANQSDLLAKAKAQGNQNIEMMRFIAESAGWTLKIDSTTVAPTPIK
nr:DUF4230 domain-containing protein [Saprospiraceae bacterium]